MIFQITTENEIRKSKEMEVVKESFFTNYVFCSIFAREFFWVYSLGRKNL